MVWLIVMQLSTWYMFHKDSVHSGVAEGRGAITAPIVLWDIRLDAYSGNEDHCHSSPAIGDLDGD